MQIIISDKSSAPIYEQITKQIKEGILNHALAPDEMLPSIRQLAKELQISVITTKRAYEELENEGLIYSVPQKGFFVSPSKVEILREKRLKLIEDTAAQLIKEGKAAGLSLDEVQTMYLSENKLLLMTDDKSPARISHRLFAINRSEMRISVKIHLK